MKVWNSSSGTGLDAESNSGHAVAAQTFSSASVAVLGVNANGGNGLKGTAVNGGSAVIGVNSGSSGWAVVGDSMEGGRAIVGLNSSNSGWSGHFDGRVHIAGAVGLGTESPGNILTVVQGSSTDPIADAWTVHSSRRWKDNIATISAPVEKVRKLRGVTFKWKKTRQADIGLIAEEVAQVVPEIVQMEDDGKNAKGLDYARLVPLLIEGMKQQQVEIETLRGDVKALKSALAARTTNSGSAAGSR